MPYTIPDNDEAFNTNQSVIMQTDINALVAGIGGDGVISGCAVTAQGSPDMTVAVASGTVRISAVNVTVSSGNVTITTADGTNPRIDLIVVNSSGTKSVSAGTAAASPKAPDIPASSVLLAMVYVPASDTTIATDQITDKRVVIPQIATLTSQALTDGATINWNVASGAFATVTLGGNRTLANPTNLLAGASYAVKVTQDGTGSRTLAYGSVYKWAGGVVPVLSTAASAVDILTFISDGTNMYGAAQKAYA